MEDKKVNEDTKDHVIQTPTDIMKLPHVSCKCGSIVWESGIMLKRYDSKETGPKNIPVEIFSCKRCGSLLQDGVQVLSLKK